VSGAGKALAALALIGALALGGGAARAQSAAAPGHDPSLPIEITADSLEIQREQSLAVFRGDVLAIQGEMHLRAQTLVVHYLEDETREEGTTISQIDASGEVFVSSPSETARGDVGIYDVEAGIIDLTGAVVLTRGENVVKGNHLVMDLNTGYSRMESAGGADGERVKSIFVPEQKDGEN
jgi:lipopolysaccharide export system protein LptA